VEVLLADVVIDAVDTALEDPEESFTVFVDTSPRTYSRSV